MTPALPQGTHLSPTFYLTYMKDKPKTPKLQLTLFSNETIFLTQNKNAKRAQIQLQHQFNLVLKCFYRYRLKINFSKTINIIFGHNHTIHITPL